jgi:hypothetical protein
MSSHFTDVDAILSVTPPDRDAPTHSVDSPTPAGFAWDYNLRDGSGLARLYAKATANQWQADDLPWDTDVDPERLDALSAVDAAARRQQFADTPVGCWGDAEWMAFAVASRRWMLSQFLHGEQGALLCSAKLVEAVPDTLMKANGSAQVIDEMRHVEVFARYTNDKLGGAFPINSHLSSLLDDTIGDARWDVTYLGMQVMVEGLALAAFGFMRQITTDPLLAELLRNVMRDEARHVAFGTLALAEVYRDLSAAELAERAELAFEASLRMRDRLLQQEVWESFGVNPRDVIPALLADPNRGEFQALLFTKIVPNCRKLGLLDANGGWLRDRFADIGVLRFEFADANDPDVEN